MKKVLLCAVLALTMIMPALAGTKMVFGSISQLKGEKNIPVSLNWEEAVYNNNGKLDDFLYKARRDESWESKSLAYFLEEANFRVDKYGTTFVSADKGSDSNFRIEILTHTIAKSGHIKGEILLYSADSKEPVASVSFSSDDKDDDDKIAFRDQLKSIGESFGKLLDKQIKLSNVK